MAMWNGRFRRGLDPKALRFSASLNVDKKLFREDIDGSIAHVEMLGKTKIISAADAKRIKRALRQIMQEIRTGKLAFNDRNDRRRRFVGEDIHMAIEQRLIEKIGELGGKLHTARSRNDQIALDERLYLKRVIKSLMLLIRRFQKTCIDKASQYSTVIMPGYTHMQPAQPVLFAHHLLAYVSMLQRDRERLDDCLKRVNRSPLGAGALAGTSFRIDRHFVARKLGFDSIIENSIDAVSDRDVQIEFLAACAIIIMHLSRFAEELVLWSSQEWSFAEIPDEFTTGSSIMPQKKNPDMAELVRGKSGRIYGDLIALLTVMKGLPLAYNRDMQEDKEALFDAAETVSQCLEIFSSMLRSTTIHARRFEKSVDFLLATDLADYLVRKGMPFRKAHGVVAGIVRDCLAKKITLKELSAQEYQRHSKLFGTDLWKILDARASLLQKKSSGSTSPKEVGRSIRAWNRKFRSL